MTHEINDIDDLIGKVLAGEASAEEHLRLEQWTDISAENQKYFDQLKAIFEKAGANKIEFEFDADAAWNKVKRKLNTTEKDRHPSFPEEISFVRLAAGIVFLLGIGMVAYLLQSKTSSIETFAVASDSTTVESTLPDGSTAFLNAASSIVYEFNPSRKTRNVKLNGEGFFEVKHEQEKPFVIEANEVLIRDIGTSFNIKAYPESDSVTVSVESGEVQLYTIDNAGINLTGGETGIYSKSLRQFSKLENIDTNTLAYKTKILSFNNTDLKTVIEKINEVYRCRIKLENTALMSCRLTVNFHDEKLETIIDIIAETLTLKVTRDKKEILLSGQGCN